MLTIGEFARLGQVSARMLRHYDEIGLLPPAHVDPVTGYRSYAVGQLARLHRLLALRDLGFTLEQVRELLDDDLPTQQLRGMLRIRQAQIEQSVAAEQDRLRRVEAHLRALEGSPAMSQDIVIKTTEPLRIAQSTATAPGFGDQLPPVLGPLYHRVLDHLGRAGATPGLCVAHYDAPAEDGSVVVHAGFALDGQEVGPGDGVEIVDLPTVEVASLVHRGPLPDAVPVYEALLRWIDDSGYHLAGPSRELYLEIHEDDPAATITEIQMAIEKATV